MIIKKKILDKIMGADVQELEDEQYTQSQELDNTYNEPAENTHQNNQYDENQYQEQNDNSDSELNNNITEEYNDSQILPSNPTPEPTVEPPAPPVVKEEEINLFDLDNIDFTQRQERRRGNRRRGFRRIDDRNLVSRAREEAESIRDTAQKEGYQAGLEQAQTDINEMKEALSQFVNAKQEVFDTIAPQLLELSVDIAKKIINKEIEQSPQVLFNTIVDVLKNSLSKEETKVTLRVNPAEVHEVKQAIPELIDLAGIDTKVVVLSDDEVTEGGCQVTTTNGIVDATLESRIGVVTQALREL